MTIDFGGGLGLKYSPACIRVKAGTDVTFNGSFSNHPLRAGDAGPPATVDPNSPIKSTDAGSTATFTMSAAGTYPYYCNFHKPGMAGAVFVE